MFKSLFKYFKNNPIVKPQFVNRDKAAQMLGVHIDSFHLYEKYFKTVNSMYSLKEIEDLKPKIMRFYYNTVRKEEEPIKYSAKLHRIDEIDFKIEQLTTKNLGEL